MPLYDDKKSKDESSAKASIAPSTPPPSGNCGTCGHEGFHHHGGLKGYCNKTDCKCLEFKA